MFIKKNKTLLDEINSAEMQGASFGDLKPKYVELNTFDVDMDNPIYRIFQADFLLKDWRNETLTHVKAHPETWGDAFENPLLGMKYRTEIPNEILSLAGVVKNFYALSWTIDRAENLSNWSEFSHKNPAVRVKSTPRKLMSHLMHVEDNYFMLHHFLGLVHYRSEEEILGWLRNTPYEDHLDSLGQGPALSLMVLRTTFSPEEEARLLYSHFPDADDPWVNHNVAVSSECCALPFEWRGVMEEVLLGPTITNKRERELRSCMQKQKIDCEVRDSVFR